MTAKNSEVLYWISTILFALAMFADGIGSITGTKAKQEIMIHLGYPVYVLTILGIAKLLGAAAILQTKFNTVKEWAYAGFAFNFIGAAMSGMFVGSGAELIVFPIVALVIMFIPYYFWKQSGLTGRETI